MEILRHTWHILNESAIYLLIGFGLAGLLHVLLARYRRLTQLIASPRPRSVYLAALLGLPMPLCSCSVLPAAVALRKEGASKGATASFLVSVPETDVVSIILTYALLGPFVAIYRPLAALATAMGAGVLVDKVDAWASRGEAAVDEAPQACHDPQENPAAKKGWLATALRYGFVDMFDDMILQLLLGIVIAGALLAWLPGFESLGLAGGGVLTYLVMLAIGIPLYVCATASTPVALGLVAGGVSPGAALVFLLTGPATNIASLLVLKKHLGTAALVAYWGAIAVMSVIFGVALDLFAGTDAVREAVTHSAHEHEPTWAHLAGSVVLLLLIGASLVRRIRRGPPRPSTVASGAPEESRV